MAVNNISFNPNEHITKLPRYTKDSSGNSIKVEDDYLEVKWRLVWFRSAYPQGTIETEELCVDLDREISVERSKWVNRKKEIYTVTAKGYARYRATVLTGEGGKATGTKSESAVDFPDFCEKAETGAIGRALAALGFGTQFTGDELQESHRIVDAPVQSDKVEVAPTTKQIAQPSAPAPIPMQDQHPTSKELYNLGKQAGMWRIAEEFYTEVSRLLEITCTKDTSLTLEQRRLLASIIEAGKDYASSKQDQVAEKPAQEKPKLTVVPTPTHPSKAISDAYDAAVQANPAITVKQIESIRKLSEYLNKPEPDQITALTNNEARQIIQQLTGEYRTARAAAK